MAMFTVFSAVPFFYRNFVYRNFQDVVDLIQSLDDLTSLSEGLSKGASELVKRAFQKGSEVSNKRCLKSKP